GVRCADDYRAALARVQPGDLGAVDRGHAWAECRERSGDQRRLDVLPERALADRTDISFPGSVHRGLLVVDRRHDADRGRGRPSVRTATKHSNPPAAIWMNWARCVPSIVSSRPAAAKTAATAARRQPIPTLSGCSCWLPSAATGATRVADRAGSTADARVTA